MAIDLAERYIDPNCTYDFWLRPADVPSLDEAKRRGMNCVVLAHLVMQDLFDYTLPSDLRCTEMFLDTTHFVRTAYHPADLAEGDLLWFGKPAPVSAVEEFTPQYDESGHLQNWRDFPVNHVGIYVGQAAGEPQVLHSVARENTTVWPLSKFAEIPRYSVVWGSSRLIAASAA
jgi:hypothetical protein